MHSEYSLIIIRQQQYNAMHDHILKDWYCTS